ncbi:raffinose/stachyose/melibiose transport system substrate-binding protein [Paenibacillus endophyticus]|uniref:Raffinose/stachyose/melibiose transport system substrate-binding protein n=1 Tax=Paenibacillus endophyticus TaxID=1294268 RepID=A0A7W5CE27_9BACL|nr:sugar ABC transporter substrate-binding protein [Paenibacillus endophyticus]MBB3155917.1 raffinose/stachyose/melibiose transport system substrate-binding protein [Paenibacillus endophyticus]
MKKTSLLLLITVLCLSVVLAACGNTSNTGNTNNEGSTNNATKGENQPKPVKLSILAWNNEKEMKPLIDGFKEKYPHITFDFQFAPPVADYVAKLQTMLLSDTAPDIFMIAAENRNEIIDGDFALDLTDEPFMKIMLDSNKSMVSKDGRTYAFSQSGWAGGLFYNKELFQKAGITQLPETWDEFIEACLKLKEIGVIPLYDRMHDITIMQSAMFGSNVLSKDPTFDEKLFKGEATFAEGWTEVLTMWKEGLIDNKILTPDMIGMTSDQVATEFALGNVAMFPGGPWNIGPVEEMNPDIDFEIMGIPGKEPGNKYYNGAPGTGFAINVKTKNKEEAMLFLEYMASHEGLKQFEEGTGGIITVQGYESEVDPRYLPAYRDGLMASKIYLPMVTWNRHQEALRNQFLVSYQDIVVGKITPEQATASLDNKLKEMDNK